MNAYTSIILAQSDAPAAAEGAAQAPSPLSSFMPLIAIAFIFYFLIIRPQQKRAKEHAALLSAIKTGDTVVTNSGIHGLISNVKEKTFIVKIADNVKIEVDKSAIARVESASAEG